MNKQSKIWHIIFGIVAALLAANLLCAAVYTLPAKYSVSGKATGEIWEADSLVIHGLEGFAINHTDALGYNNPPGILEQEHAVALGSSHTQAFNVHQKKNYCSVYNEYAQAQSLPLLYNAGMDANNFADIVKHFPAAVGEFPDAQYFLIETPYFNFTEEQLIDALDAVEYDKTAESPSLLKKAYGFVQSLPLARIIVKQLLDTDTTEFETAFFQATKQPESVAHAINFSTYKALLTQCFALLRDTTDAPILLLYHLEPTLTEQGLVTPTEEIDDQPVLPLIQSLCEQYDITLLYPQELYEQNYQQNQTLPYGFSNTVYGEGHFNQTGHALIAQMLIDHAEEDKK